MEDVTKSLIGIGMKYPIVVDQFGRVLSSDYMDRINQSIQIILSTPKGARLLQPEFGSDLYTLRFDPIDSILMSKIDDCIRGDLGTWEHRIVVDDIQFKDSDDLREQGILYVVIGYHLLNTNISGNYVYPYQLGPRPVVDTSIRYGGESDA
jgi:phage baseplate assembly protein W